MSLLYYNKFNIYVVKTTKVEKIMDYKFISNTEIFSGISEKEIEAILKCFKAYTKNYKKGEIIHQAGSKIKTMGLVISGSINIEQIDVWGNNNIFDNIEKGSVFAETYACVPDSLLMVDVIAAQETEILFLDIKKFIKVCSSYCSFHNKIINNLLIVIASKNLNLTKKISHITPKSIRGRLISYLSFQAMKNKKTDFEIPFNRQQLADYLCVDRSAMSNELSKMQKEGLLLFNKNKFHLKKELE